MSVCDTVAAFAEHARTLAAREPMPFSKDDPAAMGFVAAAANVRATVFGIRTSSAWSLQSIAGNIVPAIGEMFLWWLVVGGGTTTRNAKPCPI